MTSPPVARPTPLRDASLDVSASRGSVMGVVTAAVAAGVITAATGSLLAALLGLIPGVCAALATILGAQGIAAAGEPLVTPVSAPMTVIDGHLVPLVPLPPTPPPVAPPDQLSPDQF